MAILDLTDRANFLDSYMHPALQGGYLAMTLSDKPKSKKQQYYLTEKGLMVLKALKK